LYTLPLRDWTRHDAKKRMHRRRRNFNVATIDERASPPQLVQKPTPFVLQLAVGGGNARYSSGTAQLGAVESVASRLGLREHDGDVAVDRDARRCTRPKPQQLWMLTIAFGVTAKHLPREKRLAPKGNETLRVKIPGMKCPQAHGKSATA